MKRSSIVFALVVLSIAFTVSCKKNKTTTPVCPVILVGYNAVTDTAITTPNILMAYAWGTVDLPGGIANSISSLSRYINVRSSGGTYQGAYNTSDNCYYTFMDSGSRPRLCKVTSTGVFSTYHCAADSLTFDGLVYNAGNNKLLAIKHSLIDTLVELTASGSTFSYTPIAKLSDDAVRYSSATVDQTTGTLYVAANFYVPSCYRVFKLTPGAASFSIIDSQSGQILDAIEYSNTDHMLYGFRHQLSPAQTLLHFIRIDPTGGSADISVSPIPISTYFSSCFDQCNNRYIASTQKYSITGSTTTWSSDSSAILQIDLSGGLIQTNYMAGLYIGLAVKP